VGERFLESRDIFKWLSWDKNVAKGRVQLTIGRLRQVSGRPEKFSAWASDFVREFRAGHFWSKYFCQIKIGKSNFSI
jgi:hypothetical protein